MTMKKTVLFLAFILASAAAFSDEVAPQVQSASMQKCQEGGAEAKRNPIPCHGNDPAAAMACYIIIRQQYGLVQDNCLQAIEELNPLPVPMQ